MDKRFIFTVVRKSDMGPQTMKKVWELLAWSLNRCLDGVVPTADFQCSPCAGGGSLAGGYRFAAIQVRGDQADNCCWLCKAGHTNPNLYWTAWGADAGWRTTRRTHETYLEELRAKNMEVPTLLDKAHGLRIGSFMIDVLHCADLGVSAHLVGNVFWEVISAKPWASTTEANVSELHKDLNEFTKKDTSRLQGKLTIERIRTTAEWPKLKAKAACTRHLSVYEYHIAQRFYSGSLHDQRREASCKLLCRFYEIIADEHMFLPDDHRKELKTLGGQLVGLYTSLAQEALENGIRAWKMTAKVHIFQHLCEWQAAEYQGPRFYWTYCDEDMIGHMVEVAQSTHQRTVVQTCLYKWLVLVFLVESR